MSDNNLKIGVIIQARTTSIRLPEKVFAEIAGRPMLWHVASRLKLAKVINEIIIAIPDTEENDSLADFAENNKIKFYRGSEEDVLSRYYEAAKQYGLDVIVRITGDCPLIDPITVDRITGKHFAKGADYTSNIIKRTYPRGLDTEVFNFSVLEKAFYDAKENYQREHVTPYIFENPEIFKLQNIEAEGKLRRPDLRLTVDTPDDLRLISEIFRILYQPGKTIIIEEVIDLLTEKPELSKINADILQKDLKS